MIILLVCFRWATQSASGSLILLLLGDIGSPILAIFEANVLYTHSDTYSTQRGGLFPISPLNITLYRGIGTWFGTWINCSSCSQSIGERNSVCRHRECISIKQAMHQHKNATDWVTDRHCCLLRGSLLQFAPSDLFYCLLIDLIRKSAAAFDLIASHNSSWMQSHCEIMWLLLLLRVGWIPKYFHPHQLDSSQYYTHAMLWCQ